MSRPIQALGPGFLSLLGLKNNGALPGEMIDALAPVIDMLPFYVSGARETLTAAPQGVNVVANYGFTELVVPGNQVWYVDAFTVSVDTAAAGSVTFQPVQYTRNFTKVRAGTSIAIGGAAAQSWITTMGGFIALPGDTLGLAVNNAAVGVTNASATAHIARLLS